MIVLIQRVNWARIAIGGENHAEIGKGLRPGFSSAKAPAEAEPLFEEMAPTATTRHPATKSGVFAANMQITLENDGPATFILC